MIAQTKFNENLENLRRRIPVKPKEYTTKHPKTIREGLILYCRQSTLNSLQMATKKLLDENWPMPLWFDPDDIKVGFWNKFYYKKQFNSWDKKTRFKKFRAFEYLEVPLLNFFFFKRSYDEAILEAFSVNFKYAFDQLLSNKLLLEKSEILESIKATYRKKNWVACISTTFPLLDFIARKILKTNNLRRDFKKIIDLFSKAGYNFNNATKLMPSAHFSLLHMQSLEEGRPFDLMSEFEKHRKMFDFNLGIIGPPLSSFIYFGSTYYRYYTEHNENKSDLTINRHAIVHGSANDFGTEINAVKMLSFLYLVLEMEEVFEILLAE